jgi:RNA polymerase I-specific transcription initiation factor RRN6
MVSCNEDCVRRSTNSAKESCLMLHSSLNNLVQVYAFSEDLSSNAMVVSSFDPSIVDLAIDGPGRITEIRMETMQYGDIGKDAYDPGPGHTYRKHDIKFFRLYVTRSDFTVHELVICFRAPGTDEPTGSELFVEEFTRSIIRHPRQDTSKDDIITQEGEFVLSDGLTIIESPESKTESQMPKIEQSHAIMHNTRNSGLMLAALSHQEHYEDAMTTSVDVEVVTNQVKGMLEDGFDSSNIPLGTL